MTFTRSKPNQKLSKESFEKIEKQLKENGRPLEIALFNHTFQKNLNSTKTTTEVIEELKKYQNSDGGFGNAIEPDFRLPLSSPMGTSVGLRTLHSLDSYKLTKPYIQKAISYLEDSFKSYRNGWISVPKEVNDYPHTPWWHFNAETNASAIDEFWGNPAAELIGYLYYYKKLTQKLDVEKLLEFCENYMIEKKVFRSEHELYCFARLSDLLPVNKKNYHS